MLHSFIASMSIIGLPNFLRSEENKTQEIIYHFTALASFLILFKPVFDYKSGYGVKMSFPTVSFVYRKPPVPLDEEFDRREAKYNINLALFTIIGSFVYKVISYY